MRFMKSMEDYNRCSHSLRIRQNCPAFGRAGGKSPHQNYVGTEHILLGLIKEGTGVASRVLTENGAKEEAIREMIQDLLAPETPNPVIERDGYSPGRGSSGGKPQTGGKRQAAR